MTTCEPRLAGDQHTTPPRAPSAHGPVKVSECACVSEITGLRAGSPLATPWLSVSCAVVVTVCHYKDAHMGTYQGLLCVVMRIRWEWWSM